MIWYRRADGSVYASDGVLDPADVALAAKPLVAAKADKLAEIDVAYATAMTSGFVSSALGASYQYASDGESQIKLTAAAVSALVGDPVQYECTEIATGITAPVAHTAAQMKQALIDAKNKAVAYKLLQTGLRDQVAAITIQSAGSEALAVAQVQAVTVSFV